MFLNKVIVFIFFVSCSTLYSQNDTINKKSKITNQLNEVVVTATRTKRQLSKVPMPVTLVSRKQIEHVGSTRLRDIILEQTGIITVSDFGNSEGVQLQGLDAEYVLILIDGLPIIGRTAGNIDLNRISVNNIKQIEIVKGASSSLYGSEAMGGVINIITKRPEVDQLKGDVSYMTRFLAKNELDINGDFVYRKEKVTTVLGVNLNSSKGFDLRPQTEGKTAYPHQNVTANLRFDYDFSKKLQFSSTGRFFTETIYNPSGEGQINDVNIFGKLNHTINEKSNFEYSLYSTRYKTESVFNEVVSVFNQNLIRPEVKAQFSLGKAEFVSGLGANFDALERTFFDGRERYNAYYAFAQYDVNLNKKTNIVLGARFDSFNKFRSAFSPKLAIRYDVNKWLAVKPSVGFGYKVPDFRQLFFNFRNTNGGYIVLGTQTLHELYGDVEGVKAIEKELKPESSINYNLGFQVKPFSKLKVSINAFRNDISDLIDVFDTELKAEDLNLSKNTRTFSYRNISKVFTQGVEFDASYKLTSNFTFLAGYQFLDTGSKDQLSKIKRGEVFFRRTLSSPAEKLNVSNYFGLPNRSTHTANVKVFYKNFEHDFSTNVRVLFRSKYGILDTNGSGVIDDFDKFVKANAQVNIAIQKRFFNLMNLQLGVDNVFNSTGTENQKNFKNFDSVLRLGRTFYSRIQFKI